jgi:tripartite-type tricarboxylate transporter receptor subunit TctC
MHTRSRATGALLLAAGALLVSHPARSETAFPTRPVTLVVPFPAGGPSDALARAIAQQMGRHLGQPVVVENVGGAVPARPSGAKSCRGS